MFWGSSHHIRMSSSAFSPGVKSYSSLQGGLCVSRLPPALLTCSPVTVSPLHLYPTHTRLSPGLLPQRFRSPAQHLVHTISILITATSPFLVHSPIVLRDLSTRPMTFSCSQPMLPILANSSITLTSRFLCCLHSRALQFCSAFSVFNTWILKCSSLTLTSYPAHPPLCHSYWPVDRVMIMACCFVALLCAQLSSFKTLMLTCLPWQVYSPHGCWPCIETTNHC